MFAWLFFALYAFAAPTQVNFQGRVADSTGASVQGTHSLVFELYVAETGGAAVWTQSETLSLDDGFFSVGLGADSANPLDLDALNGSLWIETQVDGVSLGGRQPLVSVPYARLTDAVATVEPECGQGSAGRLYFDTVSENLRICNGEEFLRLQACADSCLPLDEVACGEQATTGCGDTCAGTGIGLDSGECGLASSFECGTVMADTCGNDCGYAGNALASSQCDGASVVTCGESIADDCGNDCGYDGEVCPDGLTCNGGQCLECAGPCCGLDVDEDLRISVAELNQCLGAAGAQTTSVQYIEIAYGHTDYLDNVCNAFGYSTFASVYGSDQCGSGSAIQYPSYCNQGWLGGSCNNGCGNTNYPGFICNP